MGASLLDERHIALRSADSIHDEVARAPHGHEVAKSRENELPVLPLGEWSIRPIMIQRYLLAPPPAHRAPGRSRQHQADAGMLREAGRRPGMTALDLLEGEGFRRIQKIDEGIGTGRDDADGLAGCVGRRIDVARPLDMIEEALKDAPRVRLSVAGELPGHAHVSPSPVVGPAALRAQDVPCHLLERLASRYLGKRTGHCLPMIGEDIEIVLELRQTLDDPCELADGIVDMPQGAHGRAVRGPEGVGENVVVEKVDVEGRDAPVEVGGDAEGEKLPDPDGAHDLEPEPAEPIMARAVRMGGQPHDKACELHRGEPETFCDHPAEKDDRQGQPEERQPGSRELHEPGECQKTVLGSAGEDTSIAGASLEYSATARGEARLHEIRGPCLRKVKLALGALVVVVEARNIGHDPVHGGGLKGWRRRGKADRHGAPEESPARDQPRGIGDAAGVERALENLLREPVDLDDQESAARVVIGWPEPGPPRDSIHQSLEDEDELIEHLPCDPTSAVLLPGNSLSWV